MRFKKPYVASLNEVRIKKEGEYAVIRYREPDVGSVRLKIGPELEEMTEQDILDLHNRILEKQAEMVAQYEHIAIEIPPGKPQLKWFREGAYWTPRGDVLRCEVSDNEEGEAVIYIDDKELSLGEFGEALTVFAGWGMRIVFVPENELEKEPRIEIKEPEED